MKRKPTDPGPRPLHLQRSPWHESDGPQIIPGVDCTYFHRHVGDGRLTAMRADEPINGWHLSVSFQSHRGDYSRYPSWDELSHARYALLPDDLDFVMHLPPRDEYVAVHDTTFHLHQHPSPAMSVSEAAVMALYAGCHADREVAEVAAAAVTAHPRWPELGGPRLAVVTVRGLEVMYGLVDTAALQPPPEVVVAYAEDGRIVERTP